MHTEKREDPLVDMGYEIRDVDYPKLRKAIIIFFAFALASGLVGAGVYIFRYRFFAVAEGARPGDPALTRRIPQGPNPLLQNNVASKTDIAYLRQEETGRLEGTGYTDDTRSTVHIPIERAMDLIVERGIKPTNNPTAATKPGNTTAPIAPEGAAVGDATSRANSGSPDMPTTTPQEGNAPPPTPGR